MPTDKDLSVVLPTEQGDRQIYCITVATMIRPLGLSLTAVQDDRSKESSWPGSALQYHIVVPLLGTVTITSAEALKQNVFFSKMERMASAIHATMEQTTLKLCCYCRFIRSTRQLLKLLTNSVKTLKANLQIHLNASTIFGAIMFKNRQTHK